MQILWSEIALTPEGWQSNVRICIDDRGNLSAVEADCEPDGYRTGILLPAPANLHSHAFQRAFAGLTERRSSHSTDSFWTWRSQMYRFLQVLSPDDIEAITALVQMEMLEAGYASVCEFHYVHHQADGKAYDNPAELSHRILAAARETGIGLTLLPVYYQYAGCQKQALESTQLRFRNTEKQFQRLMEKCKPSLLGLSGDACLGAAAHSLRAVSPEGLSFIVTIASGLPIHLHIAEQLDEVVEVKTALGQRPVEWLLDHYPVNHKWTLIHATHMLEEETRALAQSGAVAGVCPITEANLGDGIFNATLFLAQGGRIGVGSDSNVRISLTEELRSLEYSQRLRDQQRTVLASEQASTGRYIFEAITQGSAQAAGRNAGAIQTGHCADLLALDKQALTLFGKTGDEVLDAYIFAGDDRLVSDVWSAGRHMVRQGRHIHRDSIIERYRKSLSSVENRI